MHLDLNILTKKRNKTETVTKKTKETKPKTICSALLPENRTTNGTMLQSEGN